MHHGDISLNNLGYDVSPEGKPEGVLNDYDLASWDKFPTTNNDRTGTIPFMSLEMLDGGLEKRIPRLYRHDAESFVWVLTYATIIELQYSGHSVKISRPMFVEPWFSGDQQNHLSSKRSLNGHYGRRYKVTEPHEQYVTTIRSLIDYWVRFELDLFDLRSNGSTKQDTDDPEGVLRSLIEGVETRLGADTQNRFAKVRTLILEAISTSKDT